jgi:hypothetical protein
MNCVNYKSEAAMVVSFFGRFMFSDFLIRPVVLIGTPVFFVHFFMSSYVNLFLRVHPSSVYYYVFISFFLPMERQAFSCHI